MEKDLNVTILNDIYGELLTPRQREVINLYYYDDNSLGEIALELGISRQSVRDSVVAAEKTLYELDEKLQIKDKLTRISLLLEEGNKAVDAKDNKKIKEALAAIKDVVEE